MKSTCGAEAIGQGGMLITRLGVRRKCQEKDAWTWEHRGAAAVHRAVAACRSSRRIERVSVGYGEERAARSLRTKWRKSAYRESYRAGPAATGSGIKQDVNALRRH